MRNRLLAMLAALSMALPVAFTVQAAPASASGTGDDILERLKAVPGLTVVSEGRPVPGHRYFILSFTQPADHRKPRGATFQQRLTLLHRAEDAPTVLFTGGYGLPPYPGASRTEPTALIGGNQVSLEHRFFTPSRPAPADWRNLTIWQAATDEHHIVQALKPIYSGKWIQTGASKGGMTSVYHRRFYPRDIDAVVAYVAPNDHVNPADRAYDRFFETVGEPSCRKALEEVQRQALSRRDRMVALLEAEAARKGYTFAKTLGTADRGFEMTVLDTAWAFWQYRTTAACATVPAATATDEELYAWIDAVASFGFYTDQGQEYYRPYYYQAAAQLGWATMSYRHLRGLLRYKNLNQPNSVLPAELRSRHDPWPMLDVDHWVRTRSERMMFIYGENDPWGAERFTPSGRDSALYVAPGANHGANIAGLAEPDRAEATATLLRWAGVPASHPVDRVPGLPLDDMLPPA
ncbi:aminopeptidase, partial [Spongiactinospora gelatinilytica]